MERKGWEVEIEVMAALQGAASVEQERVWRRIGCRQPMRWDRRRAVIIGIEGNRLGATRVMLL